VGDILDRGDEELQLLFMLERLQLQAAAAGGALWVLNGNHEMMNAAGNFRYATPGVRACCACVRVARARAVCASRAGAGAACAGRRQLLALARPQAPAPGT
jgi:hypothetical protein